MYSKQINEFIIIFFTFSALSSLVETKITKKNTVRNQVNAGCGVCVYLDGLLLLLSIIPESHRIRKSTVNTAIS